MADDLLNLHLTEHAQIAFTALGPNDRRIISAWFDHLRNWRNDEFIRSKSRRLDADEAIYVFQTSTDILIAFKLSGNDVTIVSIFRKESLRTFEALAGQAT